MPRSSGSASPHRHTAGPLRTREDLAVLRPDLVARYDAELPGAQASVLARLLGAIDREPLPGLTDRQPGQATFTLAAGAHGPGDSRAGHGTAVVMATVRYPAEAARPFAVAEAGLTVVFSTSEPRTRPDLAAGGPYAAPTTPGSPGLPTGTPHTHAGPAYGISNGEPDAGHAAGLLAGEAGAAARAGQDSPSEPHSGPTPGLSQREPHAPARHPGGSHRSVVEPAELVRLLWGDVPLAAEIDNSVANLALARAARGDQRRPDPGDPDALGRIEQLVTDGHPLHPCCRTRGGMSVADVLAYAPEHSPVIRLRRLRVPRDRWYGTAAPILFAHPWQADRLVDRYPWLTPDGESDPVRPLMSLRTVAPVDGGPHIKTAVDVQMTSAVRTVSPAAVHNGPILSRLLRRLTADQPIEILAEIAAGAVVVDGVPQRHLAHVIREAPQLGPGELAVPMAALAALGVPVVDPYAWWERFSDLFFGPVTRVLARGVALEAHGQNTLVVLDQQQQPIRILYRDLGGVRVSASRLRASGLEPPALLGDLPSDDPAELRTKLAAAAFGTVAAELIAMFTHTRDTDPDRLWGIVARAVRATGSEDVPHLLREPLPVKATTAMRLATDPLDDRWALLPNPMAAHA
ncbi:IucA/IucC family siderophore biosynthesis protein [Actinoplanes sp. TRM 88003]|uniref:IucA/IucC family siderophore biosynthesis protein n=1 Tax=Paractinoplanes aksuensis TaxID=2939490 RepID=A0ABT1DHP9_9ACTN|nr:IucA/IucC family siderophore biosynthesis protein [Actinoplanes aksuensis]MCO8269590.1 IucA/IucC family siderophore biosynthesis protein [Actinoplanes aksuensis]